MIVLIIQKNQKFRAIFLVEELIQILKVMIEIPYNMEEVELEKILTVI